MNVRETDMTNWTSEDWETYLDETEWNVDKKSWFKTEPLRFKKRTMDVLEFSKLTYNIDHIKRKIIYFYDKKEVGVIEPWVYKYGKIVSYNHLLIELDKKYRWKWLWKKILEIYKENFSLPDEEFTRKLNVYHFFVSVWYVPVSIINDATWEENYFNEEEDLEKVWKWYSCRFEFMW